jgi:hypothetical protein
MIAPLAADGCSLVGSACRFLALPIPPSCHSAADVAAEMDRWLQRPTGPGRGHHPFGMRFRPCADHPFGVMRGRPRRELLEPLATLFRQRARGGAAIRPRPSGGLRLGRQEPGPGRRLRPFDRRLLGRVAVARWTLVVNLTSGLSGTLLLLAQMTLLARVIADAAQGRLRQVPAALVLMLATVIVARAALAYVVELSGRRTATKVMSALRAELVSAACPAARPTCRIPTAPSWRPAPSRASTAWRPTSPATSRRWSLRSRSGRRPALERRHRPGVGPDHGGHAARHPGVHEPHRPVGQCPVPSQLAGAGRALGLLPRRRAWASDPSGVDPAGPARIRRDRPRFRPGHDRPRPSQHRPGIEPWSTPAIIPGGRCGRTGLP